MTDAITRCPKCHTSFRLNDELLNSAKGSVRCGSCLTIFNAKENLISPPTQATDTTEPENPKPENSDPLSPPAHPQDDDDELIHDDAHPPLDEDEPAPTPSDFDENVFVAHHASKSEINLFERRIKEENNRELENADPDESWALSLLDDDEPEEKRGEEDSDSDATKQKQLFQIIEDEEDEQDPVFTSFDSGADAVARSEADMPPSDVLEDDTIYQHSHTDFLDAIEPEPLELTVPDKTPFWERNLFWMGLSIVAALTLAYQIALFNFDNFSRKPGLRPYYQQACAVFGCELPSLQNLDLIRIQNMVVVDHPSADNTLFVDATLLNLASFAQVFPTLQLVFTDINNEIIARLEFPPSSYVGGELAGVKDMPAQHPIHISLEIADPGAEAVNYQIGIVKP